MPKFIPRVTHSRVLFTTVAVAALTGMSAAWADPPGRVGRIGLLEGAVSFHTADQEDWSPASLNYPVTAGNSFWTEPDARVELQIGGATVRLRPSTEFDVTALDEESFQGQIGQGSVNLRVRDFGPDQYYQIVTAHGTVQITQPGRYHIDAGSADGAQPTLIEVIQGSAEFVGADTDVTITAGQSARITGSDRLALQLSSAAPDDFDRWAEQRDQQRTFVASAQYVSPDMPGAEDLDQNGTWQSADAGPVWVPHNMPADWAPYRYGHWGYVDPWGWTWIDDAPWGFAPFHYGRWVQTERGWGWTPGAIDAHPYYAPALVAFIGGPPERPSPGAAIGFGVAIGGIVGAVGWVPLGPQEVYRPPYRVSDTYVRNVNISNVRNVTVINNTVVNNNNTVVNNVTVNNYANARAATVVKADAMTGSRPIGRAVVAVTPAQLARAPIAQAGPSGIHPTAATVGATPVAIKAAGGTPPPPTQGQHERHAPGPVGAGGHPVTAVQLTHVEPPTPAAKPVPPAKLTPAAAAAFHPPAPSNAPARPVAEPSAAPVAKPGAPATEPAKPGTHETPANAAHPPGTPEHTTPPAIAPEPHPATPAARPEPASPGKPAPAPEPAGKPPAPGPHEAPTNAAHPPATPEHTTPPAIAPEPHPAPRPEPAARPEPQAAKPEPAVRPEPAARPEPPAAKPEPARPEPAKPAPAPVARPEPKPEPAPVARPEPKPEPAPVARPEPPRPAPAPAPAARPEPRPEPAPAARPEPRPAPEPAARPEPRPEPPKAAPPPAPPKPAPRPEEKKPEEKKPE